MANIVDGIVIGGAGGAIAGITVWIVQYIHIHTKCSQKIDRDKIYKWL